MRHLMNQNFHAFWSMRRNQYSAVFSHWLLPRREPRDQPRTELVPPMKNSWWRGMVTSSSPAVSAAYVLRVMECRSPNMLRGM